MKDQSENDIMQRHKLSSVLPIWPEMLVVGKEMHIQKEFKNKVQ